MSIVFTSFKHPKLPISINIPVTRKQIAYICLTAISPKFQFMISTSLLTCSLRGCKLKFYWAIILLKIKPTLSFRFSSRMSLSKSRKIFCNILTTLSSCLRERQKCDNPRENLSSFDIYPGGGFNFKRKLQSTSAFEVCLHFALVSRSRLARLSRDVLISHRSSRFPCAWLVRFG